MKKIGICVNLQKDPNLSVTENIKSIIKRAGAECEIAEEGKKYEFVISLGGDGTFLTTAGRFSECPIVGVNLGSLGFLSAIDKDNIEPELIRIIAGEFETEDRFFLESRINGKTFYALNDMVINRGTFSKLLSLKMYFNGKFVDDYRADGVIISTPTGSTAYSLSAGGPIAEPKLNVLIITPICAHSLHQRPIIVDSGTEIKISEECTGFSVMADGHEFSDTENIKEVVIKRSNKTVKIIKTGEYCFFDTVRRKFHRK